MMQGEATGHYRPCDDLTVELEDVLSPQGALIFLTAQDTRGRPPPDWSARC